VVDIRSNTTEDFILIKVGKSALESEHVMLRLEIVVVPLETIRALKFGPISGYELNIVPKFNAFLYMHTTATKRGI
jgi:hypothetical protein